MKQIATERDAEWQSNREEKKAETAKAKRKPAKKKVAVREKRQRSAQFLEELSEVCRPASRASSSR